MFRLTGSKLVLGGLGLTLFAKAAVSFPVAPLTRDSVSDIPAIQVAATPEDKSKTEEDKNSIPPLVENLNAQNNVCEAPEIVLQSLARERELIAVQKEELEEDAAAIALVRAKLQREQEDLLELKASIEDLLARVESAKTADLDRLVDFYKTMKPAEAARIMDDMDIETTIMVLGTMQPRNAAPIMARMAPVRARAVSKIILERSQLPGDQDLIGIRLK